MLNGSAPVSEPNAAIGAYRPATVSEAAGAFAREVVGQARPATPQRAKALLYAACRLGAFGESLGLELEPSVLLGAGVAERFILTGTGTLSPASRRTLQSSLRHLARALQEPSGPERARLPREHAKPPYGDAEIAGYLACAQAQSTVSRRMRASALICLGAGAGVIGSELRHVQGNDVVERSGGVLVMVGGRRARSVPVRSRFQEPLLTAARFAGEGYLLGGEDPQRRNLTDAISALFADEALARLEAGRLRSTWLHHAAQAIGLGAFMAAAGISCSQRLGDIAASLPAASEAQMVALLSGAGKP